MAVIKRLKIKRFLEPSRPGPNNSCQPVTNSERKEQQRDRKRAVEPETGGIGNQLLQDEIVSVSPGDRTRDRQLAAVPETEWRV